MSLSPGNHPFYADRFHRPEDVGRCAHPRKFLVRDGAYIRCLHCKARRPRTALEIARDAAEEAFVPSRLIDAAELAEQDPVGEITEVMWMEPAQ